MRALRLALPLAALALAGCAVTFAPDGSRHTRPDYYEVAYQSLAATDAAQTFQGGRNPGCYHEANPLIAPDGRATAGRTAAYFALAGTAHAAVSNWLNRTIDSTDDDGWRTARLIWRAASLGYEGATVAGNFGRGATPFGTRPAPGTCAP